MSLSTQQIEKAMFVGRAIAHDVIRDHMSREWTGLDPQDGDQLLAVGLTMPDWSEAYWSEAEQIARDADWSEVERIAREAYEAELASTDKEL